MKRIFSQIYFFLIFSNFLKRRYIIIFYVLLTFIAAFAVYGQVLTHPRFSPEWPLFYNWNLNLSFKDFLNWYNPFSSTGWFRPTSFITFYQIITQFLDWRNIFAFQIISIIVIIINSFFIYFFTKQIYNDTITPILTSLLSLIHPIYYSLIYNLFITDFLYQIFILWFVIIFCGNFLERKKAYIWCIAAFIIYLLALTSKEQAIGLPVFLIGFLLIMVFSNKNMINLKNKLFGYRLILVLLTLVTTIIYVAIYLSKKSGLNNTGEYRTGLNLDIIISNVLSGPLWLSHIFVLDSKTWGISRDLHNTILNNLYGVMIIIFIISYLLISIIYKKRSEIYKLLICLFFTIAFLILPLYSGGRPWHYALPVVTFLMLYSRSVTTVFEKIPSKVTRFFFISFIIILPLFLSVQNFYREMQFFDIQFKLNTEALINPPMLSSSIPKGSTIAYYPIQAKWLYGCGFLYSYIYQRADIVEIPIPDIEDMTSEVAQEYLSIDNLFFFKYSYPIWEDKTLEFKAALCSKLSRSEAERIGCQSFNEKNKINSILNVIHLNEKYYFSINGLNRKYLSYGWSAADPWGTWSDGDSSLLQFKLSTIPTNDLNLLIEGHAFITDKHPIQEIDVYVNNKYLSSLKYTLTDNAGIRTIRVPKKIIDNNNLVLIRFDYKNPKSPAELGMSEDGRRLGLGLISIKIIKEAEYKFR